MTFDSICFILGVEVENNTLAWGTQRPRLFY